MHGPLKGTESSLEKNYKNQSYKEINNRPRLE